MTRLTFEEIGIPPRSTVRGLTICEPARMVIAQIEAQDAPKPRRTLYARPLDDELYSELVRQEDEFDIQDPTPSPTLPHVYFNRVRWHGSAGNWDGLFRVSCDSRVVERLLPRTPAAGGFIAQIIGISGDGLRLFVVTTLPKRLEDTIVYAAATLDLASLELTTLTELRATFL